jgi:predicted DNA-binding protein with PD1-like motif
VFALVFETGDEIASVLQQFSKNHELAGSSFKAIGALSYVRLGWFNWETKQYDPACVLSEQLELLSCNGSRSSPAPFSRYSPARFSHSSDVAGSLSMMSREAGIGYFPV